MFLEDATFWALVGLVLFLALIVYMGVPGSIGAALDRRAEAIRTELEQARRLREEAQALLAEYQRKAREAEAEVEEIIDQAKREAEAFGSEAKPGTDEAKPGVHQLRHSPAPACSSRRRFRPIGPKAFHPRKARSSNATGLISQATSTVVNSGGKFCSG